MDTPLSPNTPPSRDPFFKAVAAALAERLPVELHGFEGAIKPGKDRMRLRFPELPDAAYELEFADNESAELNAYFGPGDKIILGFYLRGKPKTLIEWLRVMAPLSEEFSRKLGLRVAIGPWGKNRAGVAANLKGWDLQDDPRLYAGALARFVQITYSAALRARLTGEHGGEDGD